MMDALQEALKTGDYATVDEFLRTKIEMERSRSWVDWATQRAHEGHAVCCYHIARNALKAHHGAVMSSASFREALKIVLYLLLRMAQDYFACRFAFGDDPPIEVFEACRNKCLLWLKPHGDPKSWPALSLIVSEMATIRCDGMPSVAWVYDTSLSMLPLSGHVHWGKGNAAKHEAYERNPSGIAAERQRVLRAFIEELKDKDWSVLSSLTLKDLDSGMAFPTPPPPPPRPVPAPSAPLVPPHHAVPSPVPPHVTEAPPPAPPAPPTYDEVPASDSTAVAW